MRKREKENHGIVFGPNGQGHVYKPAPYHSYKAAKRKDKTRWVDDANFEYSIFNLADVHTGLPYPENIKVIDKRWMNDDGKGLYAILNQGKTYLVKLVNVLPFSRFLLMHKTHGMVTLPIANILEMNLWNIGTPSM